jgi:hypothetical protein
MESRARTQIGYFKTIRGREIAIIAIIAVIENLGERPSTQRNRGCRGTGGIDELGNLVIG